MISGLLHNPFNPGQGESLQFVTKKNSAGINQFFSSDMQHHPSNLAYKDCIFMLNVFITKSRKIVEYENIDFLQVLEAFGGLHEIFLIFTSLLVGPYQECSYRQEQKEVLKVNRIRLMSLTMQLNIFKNKIRKMYHMILSVETNQGSKNKKDKLKISRLSQIREF